MKQVTVDWDYIPHENTIIPEFTGVRDAYISSVVRAKIAAVPYWYPVKSAKWRVSSSGEGIHILVDLAVEISDIDSLLIRAVMNDDYKRLRLDMIRYLYATREIGLIFSEKILVRTGEKRVAGEWVEA